MELFAAPTELRKLPNGQTQMDLILDEFLEGQDEDVDPTALMGPLLPLSPVNAPLTPIVSGTHSKTT